MDEEPRHIETWRDWVFIGFTIVGFFGLVLTDGWPSLVFATIMTIGFARTAHLVTRGPRQ